MASLDRIRPKRQRKSVCHYSDDNPNTFTVKEKKGVESNNVDTCSYTGVRASGIKRPRSSPRSKHAINHQNKLYKKQGCSNKCDDEDEEDDEDNGVYEDDDNVIIASLAAFSPASRGLTKPPTPARRGRPPHRQSSAPNIRSTSSSTSSTSNTSKTSKSSSSNSRSTSPVGTISCTAPRTKMTTKVSAQQQQEDKRKSRFFSPLIHRPKRVRLIKPGALSTSIQRDISLSHPVSIHSLLAIDKKNTDSNLGISSSSLGAPPPPQSEWVRLDIHDDAPLRGSVDALLSDSLNSSIRSSSVGKRRGVGSISTTTSDVTGTTVAPAVSITAFNYRQQPHIRRKRPRPRNMQQQDQEYHDNYNEHDFMHLSEWVITGDCLGSVALWKIGCRRILYRLQTAAFYRDQHRVIVSKKVISYPNSIHDVAWSCDNIVLVLTETDLEGIQVLSMSERSEGSDSIELQKRLFLVNVSFSLARNVPPAQQFHFHFEKSFVLWSTDNRDILQNIIQKNNRNQENGVQLHTTTLKCLDLLSTNGNSIGSETISPETGCMFRCIVAIWDAFDLTDRNIIQQGTLNAILAVAQTSMDGLELLRIIYNELDTNVFVQDRYSITLPAGRSLNVMQLDCTIQQIAMVNYSFTLIAGNRIAIQLLDSRTLSCLATFGKSVSLHGQSVQWKTCLWIRAPTDNIDKCNIRSMRGGEGKFKLAWLEYLDELAARSRDSLPLFTESRSKNCPNTYYCKETEIDMARTARRDNSDLFHNPFWLIGIPHPFKGPKELNSTLYIWKNPLVGIHKTNHNVTFPLYRKHKLQDQQQSDTSSLEMPSGGCLGVAIAARRQNVEIFCVTATTGQLYTKRGALKSDFAGVMYPVGYKVIDDNIEYLEDEEEMDQQIIIEVINDDLEGVVQTTSKRRSRGRPKKNSLLSSATASNTYNIDIEDAYHSFFSDATSQPHINLIVSESANVDENNGTVQVLNDETKYARYDAIFFLPSWPSSCLFQKNLIDEFERGYIGSTTFNEILDCPERIQKKIFKFQYLSIFPHFHIVQRCLKQLHSTSDRQSIHLERHGANSPAASICEIQSASSCSTIVVGQFNSHHTYSNVGKQFAKSNKRTRTATVELLLQSSIDHDLRLLMSTDRGRWSNEIIKSRRKNLAIFQNRSIYNDKIALEEPKQDEEENIVPQKYNIIEVDDARGSLTVLSPQRFSKSESGPSSFDSSRNKNNIQKLEYSSFRPNHSVQPMLTTLSSSRIGTTLSYQSNEVNVNPVVTKESKTVTLLSFENRKQIFDDSFLPLKQERMIDAYYIQEKVQADCLDHGHSQLKLNGIQSNASDYLNHQNVQADSIACTGINEQAHMLSNTTFTTVPTSDQTSKSCIYLNNYPRSESSKEIELAVLHVANKASPSNCKADQCEVAVKCGIGNPFSQGKMISIDLDMCTTTASALNVTRFSSDIPSIQSSLMTKENSLNVFKPIESLNPRTITEDENHNQSIKPSSVILNDSFSINEHIHSNTFIDESITMDFRPFINSTEQKIDNVNTNQRKKDSEVEKDCNLHSDHIFDPTVSTSISLIVKQDDADVGRIHSLSTTCVEGNYKKKDEVENGHMLLTWKNSTTKGNGHASFPCGNIDNVVVFQKPSLFKQCCTACRGRMVVHVCGKRERPIDYDAIALAERERKERLSAEKALARVEKRREADKRRKEAKQLKQKEHDERIKQEEEEARRQEEQLLRYRAEERHEMEEHEKRLLMEKEKRFRDDITKHVQEEHLDTHFTTIQNFSELGDITQTRADNEGTTSAYENPYYHSTYTSSFERQQVRFPYTKRVPSYRILTQLQTPGFANGDIAHQSEIERHNSLFGVRSHEHNDYRSNTHQSNLLDITKRSALKIGHSAIQPSTSLNPSDALAALAGLADSIHVATSMKSTRHCKASNELLASTKPAAETTYESRECNYYFSEEQHEDFSYEYSGSLERQAAIHRALIDKDLSDISQEYNRGLHVPSDEHFANEQEQHSDDYTEYLYREEDNHVESTQYYHNSIPSITRKPYKSSDNIDGVDPSVMMLVNWRGNDSTFQYQEWNQDNPPTA